MHEFTKSHKRRLRILSEQLYEREVKDSLTDLSLKFDDWKSGKITSLELSHHLHEYDYGESRKLWTKYDSKRHDMLVAEGLVRGLITESDIGSDLIKELQVAINFYREVLQ